MPLEPIYLWTLLIAVVTAITCGLCGSLLLLNRQAMVSEGLSHAVLPGIVLAFIFFRSYDSPWLIPFSAASGLFMVWATETLAKTRLVDSDASLGIVFAGMFSLGILLVSLNLRHVHFHADCIIDGNLAHAPLSRWTLPIVGSLPKSFVMMTSLLITVLGFILLCYKELKVMIFDSMHAFRIGLRPRLMSYVWLSLASLTAVAAFDAAGSVLIVALMIAPPATAFLLTKRFDVFLYYSVGVSILSSVVGYAVSIALEISPTGPIASTAGMIFLAAFFFAPRQGVVATLVHASRQRSRMRASLAAEMISGCVDSQEASSTLSRVLRISSEEANAYLDELIAKQWIESHEGTFVLTENARESIGNLMRNTVV
ncbi:MAG: metal ABC transporter permease [Planctomycetota bacterium]